MPNFVILVVLAGVALIAYGVVKHIKWALWVGVGVVLLYLVLGLVDRLLGC